jgi:HrpA-like RNA helicase
VVTSATINEEMFQNYFNNCPLVKISGRTFPVEIQYSTTPVNLNDPEIYRAAAIKQVKKILKDKRLGDVLVFMPS